MNQQLNLEGHLAGQTIKCVSLTQPWATLVAIGAKQIETLSWWTSYRGPLAIHASKKFPKDCRELCYEAAFEIALEGLGPKDLPLGMVIAIATLVDCREISRGTRAAILSFGKPSEIDFGDYTSGRYAWYLEDVKPLAKPVPARGSLGLWNWEVPEGLAR